MKEPTVKQQQVLDILLSERGITYKQIATQLGVCVCAIQGRMIRLKQRCPDEYWHFCTIKVKGPTKKQLAMLHALNPFREDTNGTFKDAAKELGVSKSSVENMMLCLKERCPEVYEDFRNLRKMLNRDKRNIKNPIVMDPKDIEKLEECGKVKRIF